MGRIWNSKRFWYPLASIVLVIAMAVVINLVGIEFVGSTPAWEAWLKEAYWYLLAWRLCVYAALFYGWNRLCDRVYQDKPERQQRLRRSIRPALLAFLVIELNRAQWHWQGVAG
ncbi:hypothetical protein ACE0DR_22070 [Azotobacter sp. CWF10]